MIASSSIAVDEEQSQGGGRDYVGGMAGGGGGVEYHGGKTGGLPSRLGPFGKKGTGTGLGSKPLPDISVDFTKIANPDAWKEQYVDRYTEWSNGEVNSRPGYVEAKYGNDAFGHKAFASQSDTSGVAGLETGSVLGKAKISVGYQGGVHELDHEKIDASIGAGVNVASETIIPGVNLGIGYGIGAGIKGGLNSDKKYVGVTALTPVGSFGASVGCKTELCVFACLNVEFC